METDKLFEIEETKEIEQKKIMCDSELDTFYYKNILGTNGETWLMFDDSHIQS